MCIMPVNKKVAIVLMPEEYYNKFCKDNKLYYMNIDKDSIVENINRNTYLFAKKRNENVIGELNELNRLIKNK